jgi:hypothetical protein
VRLLAGTFSRLSLQSLDLLISFNTSKMSCRKYLCKALRGGGGALAAADGRAATAQGWGQGRGGAGHQTADKASHQAAVIPRRCCHPGAGAGCESCERDRVRDAS